MIDSDNITIGPYLGEHAFNSLDTFAPNKSIIALAEVVSQFEYRATQNKRKDNQWRLTSEKAGADIFRYFFQSSPSEATIFFPKKDKDL